jgi:hypothetical protein
MQQLSQGRDSLDPCAVQNPSIPSITSKVHSNEGESLFAPGSRHVFDAQKNTLDNR